MKKYIIWPIVSIVLIFCVILTKKVILMRDYCGDGETSFFVIFAPYRTSSDFSEFDILPKDVISRLVAISNDREACHIARISNDGKVMISTIYSNSSLDSLPSILIFEARDYRKWD